MHRLPKQLGWGLGILALVGSLVWDYQRNPAGDLTEMLTRAIMWFGLCAVFAAIVGYLVFLALGGHDADKEDEPSALPLDSMPPRPGEMMDLTDGAEPEMPPDIEEEFAAFGAEDVARAVRTQLGSE